MEHRSEEQDKVRGDQVKGFTENVMNNEELKTASLYLWKVINCKKINLMIRTTQ